MKLAKCTLFLTVAIFTPEIGIDSCIKGTALKCQWSTKIERTVLPIRHGKVNIPQEIGVRSLPRTWCSTSGRLYWCNGEGHGAQTWTRSRRINIRIFQKWLRGQERRSISWRTLIEVLRDIEWCELAKRIADIVDIEPSFPAVTLYFQVLHSISCFSHNWTP